VTLADIGYPL